MRNLLVSILVLFIDSLVAGELMIKKGDKIAFLGDSITQVGARPGGYCDLVIRTLNSKGLEVVPHFAGKSGNKSNQMLARLSKDVVSHKPQWMTLSCGVNDVWHGARGVDLEPYRKNITQIVDQAQATGIKVILLTATMIGEDQKNERNQKLEAYNNFLRELSKAKGCVLVDMNQRMQQTIKGLPKDRKGNTVTTDGVHMNAKGNRMMARGLLEALGMNSEDLNKAENLWMDIPNLVKVRIDLGMSPREGIKLRKLAEQQGTSVERLFLKLVEKEKSRLLTTP